ncbi:TldD/PmbA family protein [Candidatus Aminicenantes bacterium AC-335-K20]|jgi:TldD protein|nr:TldD/PmbA family protein [SCandidatus Aminicenantes bacterium Aminicenantia_JdfR_composite]MCP2597022.1 TldD/PmbA family protein [Candidatus Aminicenantes bacterium AC-335-G13]MCP2619365.1 TldD/PmbA family protein [Candidatus Aminicenantes bacterium AC-335-K20]
MNISKFFERFGLCKSDIEKILDFALSKGGEFSELFLEHRICKSIIMEEGIIKESSENIIYGAGVRVFSGDSIGYGYTNDLSMESLKKVALTSASISKNSSGLKIKQLSPLKISKSLYSVSNPFHKEKILNKFEFVKRVYNSAKNYDSRIKNVRIYLEDEIQYVLIANSEGLIVSDERPLVKIICISVAEKNGRRDYGYFGGGGRVGIEYFKDKYTPEKIGEQASQEAILLLDAREPPAGEMPVILAPGHSGVMIHEAVGHLLEADFNRKKTSIFWDKMGQKVASSQVTVYDDPTIPNFRGSLNVDDEGTIPKKTLLIENGILKGLLQDRLSSKIMKMPLTGHGRRQNYKFIPIPRMTNTYVEKGEYSPEEIIKSVKKGFYALKYQGGQVEDSGKFTFSVSLGYLIEDGKLTAPVKQATLIGTNIDILNKIEMVGCDVEFGMQTGTCGKNGQSVPVTDGCPTIKISRMTVGGRK